MSQAGRCCSSVLVEAFHLQAPLHLPSSLDVPVQDGAVMSLDCCSCAAVLAAQGMIVAVSMEHPSEGSSVLFQAEHVLLVEVAHYLLVRALHLNILFGQNSFDLLAVSAEVESVLAEGEH